MIININGPINAGKSTVSKILQNLLQNSIFIEVDDLLSDDEQEELKLDFWGGIYERLNRLDDVLLSNTAENIIFAYPLTESNYARWNAIIKDDDLICITLAPSLENCLKNRGTRELDEFELNRIKEMYEEGYQHPKSSNLIICNDNQTPQETAQTVLNFLENIAK